MKETNKTTAKPILIFTGSKDLSKEQEQQFEKFKSHRKEIIPKVFDVLNSYELETPESLSVLINSISFAISMVNLDIRAASTDIVCKAIKSSVNEDIQRELRKQKQEQKEPQAVKKVEE